MHGSLSLQRKNPAEVIGMFSERFILGKVVISCNGK